MSTEKQTSLDICIYHFQEQYRERQNDSGTIIVLTYLKKIEGHQQPLACILRRMKDLKKINET